MLNFSSSLLEKVEFLLGHKNYKLIFSALFSAFSTLSFYPGILYSDSHYRWTMAKYFSNFGWGGQIPLEDHHPVVPAMIMSYFFDLTQEVGFFIFVQGFFYCFAIFYIVEQFKKSAFANAITSLLILYAVNSVFAIFHSFDTVTGITLLFLAAFIIQYWNGNKKVLFFIPFLFFLSVAFRLNTFATTPFLLIFLLFLMYQKSESKIKMAAFAISLVLLGYAPFLITSSLDLRKTNAWVVGLSFEYGMMAPKAKEAKHEKFLNKIGLTKQDINNNSYHTEANGTSSAVLRKVKNDRDLSLELAKNYFSIIVEEPGLFIVEKSKFIASILGISKDLINSEIGKWREVNESNWEQTFLTHYSFITNGYKESVIDKYNAVSNFNTLILKPYLLILFATFFIVIIGLLISWTFAFKISIIGILGTLYYSTFFLLTATHIFRYFYPAFYLLEIQIILSLIVILDHLLVSKKVGFKRLINGGVIALFFLGSTINTNQAYSNEINRIIEKGEKLTSDETMMIVEHEAYLYFISQKPTPNLYDSPFFFHITPQRVDDLPENRKVHGFDNLDFAYSTNKVEIPRLPFQNSIFVVKLKLPEYDIKAVRTGQYNSDGDIWSLTKTFED